MVQEAGVSVGVPAMLLPWHVTPCKPPGLCPSIRTGQLLRHHPVEQVLLLGAPTRDANEPSSPFQVEEEPEAQPHRSPGSKVDTGLLSF